ncbi:MAG: c-type cytochrome [Gammaproteobacteria bacterium]
MQLRAVLIGLALSGLLASPAAVADARPVAVETCMGCHGITGVKNAYPGYHVPKLGGQHAEYIAAALRAYANGERPHSTMHANAATLTEEQVTIIAQWFQEQGR